MFDLEAYFKRIAYAGPRAPTLAALRAICAAQPAAIAFENIDPLLGRAPLLGLDVLQAKLVGQRRGGYCFELNALLRAALEALGMQVTGLAARVVWMRPPGTPPRPRTHMLLKVELPDAPGRPYIADAGFGGHLLGVPLALEPLAEQTSPHGRLRIVHDEDSGQRRAAPSGPSSPRGMVPKAPRGGHYVVEAELPEGWAPLYRYTLEAQLAADYEPLNWYTATLPVSLFRHNLLLERLTPALRASLLNDQLTLRATAGAPAERRRIDSAADFAQVLDRVFDLAPPLPAAELFERVPRGLDGAYIPQPS